MYPLYKFAHEDVPSRSLASPVLYGMQTKVMRKPLT